MEMAIVAGTGRGSRRYRSSRQAFTLACCILFAACSSGTSGEVLQVEEWRQPYLNAVASTIDDRRPGFEDRGIAFDQTAECQLLIAIATLPRELLERADVETWQNEWGMPGFVDIFFTDDRSAELFEINDNDARSACDSAAGDLEEAYEIARR